MTFTPDDVKDILKILMPLLLALVGVLKNRTELDIYAACERAKARGKCVDSQMYWRWYHRLFFVKRKVKHLEETRNGGESRRNPGPDAGP